LYARYRRRAPIVAADFRKHFETLLRRTAFLDEVTGGGRTLK